MTFMNAWQDRKMWERWEADDGDVDVELANDICCCWNEVENDNLNIFVVNHAKYEAGTGELMQVVLPQSALTLDQRTNNKSRLLQ